MGSEMCIRDRDIWGLVGLQRLTVMAIEFGFVVERVDVAHATDEGNLDGSTSSRGKTGVRRIAPRFSLQQVC